MKESKKRSKKSKDEIDVNEETVQHKKKKSQKDENAVREENPSGANNVKSDEKIEKEDEETVKQDKRMQVDETTGSNKKKRKKHKKDKKRIVEEISENEDTSSEAKKTTSKEKNTRNEGVEDEEDEGGNINVESTKEGVTKRKSKSESSSSSLKEKRAQRKAERQRLMELVPLTDDQGISYTKQQIRRMRKRVARGLPPLETEEEIRERQKAEALLRKEEEAELHGMIYQKDGTVKPEDDDNNEDEEDLDEERNEGGNNTDEDDEKEELLDDNGGSPTTNTGNDDSSPKRSPEHSPRKKTRRNKPVPPDYVCQACKNKETPPLHWIYDCPQKVTMPGCNHKSNKNHVNEPSDHKVFVSGLPFDAKSKDVRQLFSSCGEIRNVKLMTFEDTKRCKGNAFITFENKDAAVAALKLSGTPLDNVSGEEEGKKRKTLTLKVSKLLNRTLTKKNAKNSPLKK